MSLSCPNGHATLNPTARFCLTCGLPLVATGLGETPAPAAAPQQPPRFAPPPEAFPPPQNLVRPPPLACARHPDRGALPCPRCGTFACPECLVRLPDGSELCADCAARETDLLPWDRREELGTLRAFWQTCLRVITRPTLAFGTARPTGTVGSSLWFGTLSQVAGWISTLGMYALLFGAMGIALLFGTEKTGPSGGEAGIIFLVMIGMFLLLVGMSVVGLLLNTALDHLVLKLVDAQPKSFAVSLRAASLAQAPALTGLIPLCSLYVWPVWALVLKVFAYRAFHQTSWGKAALGALLVPGIFIALGLAFYAVVIVLAGTGALDNL